MTNHEDILNRLDTLVRDIASLGLYAMADRLEEFTGDLEETHPIRLAQPARPLCKGIPRRGCNYLAPCDTVCNKCGEIHHHHQMVAQFQAAQQPEPDAIEQALAHAEAFSRGHDAGWQSAMLCAALTQALKRE